MRLLGPVVEATQSGFVESRCRTSGSFGYVSGRTASPFTSIAQPSADAGQTFRDSSRNCDDLRPQFRQNIAEGCGHAGKREFARFLQIAIASAFELEYHLLLAAELAILQRSTYLELETEVKGVKKMLTALIQRVRAVSPPEAARDVLLEPTTDDREPTTDDPVVR